MENSNIKGIFFIDSLRGEIFEGIEFEDEFGVFYTGSNEIGKEGHCYFYASENEARIFCEERNNRLKQLGYFLE